MNETKHTTGPWEVVDVGQCMAIVMAKHLRITVDHRENFGSATPDARLIAAAPELLDMLKEVLANRGNVDANVLRELIAKAEGSNACQPSEPANK